MGAEPKSAQGALEAKTLMLLKRAFYRLPFRARLLDLLRSVIVRAAVDPSDGMIRVWAGANRGFKFPRSDYFADVLAVCLGTYELRVTEAIRRFLRPGDTAVDVGAHFGHHSMVMSRCVGPGGRVLAFEPNPRTFAGLGQTLAANRAANVLGVELALGSSGGPRRFKTLPVAGDGMAGFEDAGLEQRLPERGLPADLRPETIEVASGTLDDYLDGHPFGPVSLVKIDVEGAELEVLRGMRRLIEQHHPAIIAELTGPEERSAAEAFLRDFGYASETLESWDVPLRNGTKTYAVNELFFRR